MSILVVGSVAFDSVETPFGKAEDVLGGSATYFSTSASYFTDVSLVAVVGEDFPDEHVTLLTDRKVDVSGLTKVPGETFRWKGRYDYDLNQAHTLETHLNVFSDFEPEIPEDHRDNDFLFLANIDPELQLKVLDQVTGARFTACDTMNFWIESKIEKVKEVFSRVDLVVINEGEAREFAGEASLVKAAKKVLALGPRIIIIKRGEYGAIMFTETTVFSAPAYPLEEIFDPTGAGDTFAGGMMGLVASTGDISEANIRRAIVLGSTMASFNVEAFSLDRLKDLKTEEINDRYGEFKRLTHFEGL